MPDAFLVLLCFAGDWVASTVCMRAIYDPCVEVCLFVCRMVGMPAFLTWHLVTFVLLCGLHVGDVIDPLVN
jgi:hypothetical protein